MHAHHLENKSEDRETKPVSRLEMLIENYMDIAKAITHKALEEAVQAEFEEFMDPVF